MNEEMTDSHRRDREAGRQRKRLPSDGVSSLMEKHCHPEAQYIYYTELKRDTGLLHPDKQRGRVYGIQLDQGDGFR